MIALKKTGTVRGEHYFDIWRNNKPTGATIIISQMGTRKFEISSNDINPGMTGEATNYTSALIEAKQMAEDWFNK